MFIDLFFRFKYFQPEFQGLPFNVSVDENERLPQKVIRVQATDKDTGTSGEIVYAIESQDADIFFINGQTGIFPWYSSFILTCYKQISHL